MEPVTHLLTGATLSRAGFNRRSALATVTMTLAAEAADIDVLAYFKGSAYGFIQHRGITHTFFAVPVLAALVVGAVALADALWQRLRRRGAPPSPQRRWGWLYLSACVAALSHLLLDFTNNYGLRPFYPFLRHWHAWDIVFIFDPLIFAVLVAALVLPWLFGLVDREIGVPESGARQSAPRGRAASIAALIFVVALWGVRDVEHRRAVAAMEAMEFRGEPAIRVAAFPTMANPFQWAGIAETSTAYVSLWVDSLHSEADPGDRAESYYKPQPTEAAQAARNSDLGRAYLEWARFPLVEDEELQGPAPAHLVHFLDVRFIYPESRRRPLAAFVLLDSDLQPAEEGFESLKRQR
jgi:inner membrane protein